LELASALKELEGRLRIWMAGSSPQPQEEADFWQRARSMGLAGCLRWFRQMPQGAVVRLLDALRAEGGVFVSTSRADSFGLTVAEAMARGCAVVVPRYGPFPEYVRNEENGLLYSPGGSGALQAVLRLLDNADLRRRLGEQAQRDIRARHAPRFALRELSRALSWAARLGEGGSGAERQAWQ
jgi:glycosyltransferase involved in cell wall biosynthesis